MNCAFDKEKLTGYYDGELEAAEKAEVERHIASCSECLRELGELKSAAILVKELPRLRAPRSIAEGVSREIQAAGKVHSFAKMRRVVVWASAAAAALFIGLNLMYFSSADKSAGAPPMAKAPVSSGPAVLGKVQQQEQQNKDEVAKTAGEKEMIAGRRGLADRAPADPQLAETRKAVEESERKLRARDDAAGKDVAKKAVAEAPAERSREKDKADGLAKAPETKPAAEPAAPPAPAKSAAPPGAAPAPVAKPAAAPPPAPEAAEKAATKENLARAESEFRGKRVATAAEPAAAEAPATHMTLAATQISKARPQLEAALGKIGAALPPAPPPVKNMKAQAARETETTISLELTDSQIARLRQELDKPGASLLINAAPGDPVFAQFREGGMFGAKKEGAAATGGGAAAGPKAKELPKPEAKADAPKDAKESKDADAPSHVLADKGGVEPRRKILLHLVEVPYVPDAKPALDALKK